MAISTVQAFRSAATCSRARRYTKPNANFRRVVVCSAAGKPEGSEHGVFSRRNALLVPLLSYGAAVVFPKIAAADDLVIPPPETISAEPLTGTPSASTPSTGSPESAPQPVPRDSPAPGGVGEEAPPTLLNGDGSKAQPPKTSSKVPLGSQELTEEATKKLLEEEEDRRKSRRRKKGRIRELEEIRAELAEKELVLLEKQQELLAEEQTVMVLREELEIERKLRALLTKEKEKAEEEAALAMGLCMGGSMLP